MLAIAIPAYDMHTHGVFFLRRALDSISRQSGIDLSQIEVVVSDQSVDFAIEKFIGSYQAPFQLHHVRNSTHFGNISQNVNNATQFVLQNCSSRYIKILFQDDFLLGENYLSQLLKITQTNADVIFTGATHSRDGENFYNAISPQNNPFLIFGQNSISSPSTLTLSRRACEQVICDEKIKLFMDVDWYYRLFKAFEKIVFAPELLVVNGVWEGQSQHQFDAKSFVRELSHVLTKYEADKLREQVPEYLKMLYLKYPDHAAHIDPLVRPLQHPIPQVSDQGSTPKANNTVDVVLTTHNAQNHINFTIRNAFLQSHRPQTIYVIDTASSDETAQMVQQIYLHTPEVRFISSFSTHIWQAREEGMALSNATYIAFLNCTEADHPRWNANYLENQLGNLQSEPQVIGSLGQIKTSEPENPSCPLLLQLPSRGYASNVVLRNEMAIRQSNFLEQLQLAEQNSQWQLLALQFSFSLENHALTCPSYSSHPQPKYDNQVCGNIFSWWSKHSDVIESNPNLLSLIRQAFIAQAIAPRLSLYARFKKFHHTYGILKSALSPKLAQYAGVIYTQLIFEIISIHYRQLWNRFKRFSGNFSLVIKVRQALAR